MNRAPTNNEEPRTNGENPIPEVRGIRQCRRIIVCLRSMTNTKEKNFLALRTLTRLKSGFGLLNEFSWSWDAQMRKSCSWLVSPWMEKHKSGGKVRKGYIRRLKESSPGKTSSEKWQLDTFQGFFKTGRLWNSHKLVQGYMTVTQYETKFMELSRYKPNLIPTEKDKAKKFQDGLRKAIWDRIVPFIIEECPEAVRRALVVEETLGGEATTEATPFQRGWKNKKPFGRGKGGGADQSGAKRQKIEATPCTIYNKTHFGECWFADKTWHNCGAVGHLRRNCPKSPQQSSRKAERHHQRRSQGGRQRHGRYHLCSWMPC